MIFLFLRTVSATIIPALAVPISLIATFAVMYALDFSINNMTLLALTLSVGFVVDDAIVMLENIVRHIEGGMRPFEAALKGAREIGFTIISITFSLIAVFIPVLLMGGMVGRVFREFAVTIAVAIIVSGFVSLTLTPMLCARVLRGHHREGEEAERRAARVRVRCSMRWLKGYEWSLDKVLSYKFVMLLVTLGTMVGTVWLYIAIPKGFFPRRRHRLSSRRSAEAPADISFRAMRERQQQGRRDRPARIRRSLYVNSTVGVGGPNSTLNNGRMFVALKPKAERGKLDPVHAAAAPRDRSSVAGMRVYFHEIQNINLGGRIAKGEFQYTMQSSDTETLYKLAPRCASRSRRSPGLRDVNTDLYVKNPQIEIEIDREKAGVLRHHRRPDPPGAVQRVRQPPGRDDLHADQRLPGHPGDASPSSRHDPSEAVDRSSSRPTSPTRRSRRHARSGGGVGIAGIGTPNGMSIPLSAVTQAGDRPSARCRSTTRASSPR